MVAAMRVLLLLLALARCRSFLVVPAPLAASTTSAAAAEPGPACSRRAQQHRGPPSRLHSSPGMSPEDMDKARQRLIGSSGYKKMIDRVDGNSPFADLDGSSSSRGVKEEEEEPPASSFLRQTVRATVDVGIALVPVVLVVTFVKFPPPVLEALGSAAAAIKASPLEPVLEALPWEPMVVLKSVALGGVATLLSPVADRLVVSPSIHLWAQARIRSLSS